MPCLVVKISPPPLSRLFELFVYILMPVHTRFENMHIILPPPHRVPSAPPQRARIKTLLSV